ncbi:DoxX family protein [Patulibacter sp.]|uniref:DoxX family protein n=1 Tax=Patulibacter sp. TaxID=1912859 RepID=UPI002715AAB5|nr:DoxX family membrane protein [Patulibacter sp.]MDO9409812.1 DoxX family membrane protein [Patulibacter sp.]
MRSLVVLARPLLAYGFVTGGVQALKSPAGLVGMSERVGVPQAGRVVPVTSATMIAAGTAMAVGVRPRTSALTLAGCLVGFTYTLHGFWRETEEKPRRAKRQAFVTNAGTLGGLLAVAAASSRD